MWRRALQFHPFMRVMFCLGFTIPIQAMVVPIVGPTASYVMCLPAVMLIAMTADWVYALLATGLGVGLTVTLYFDSWSDPHPFASLLTFLGVNGCLVALGAYLQREQRQVGEAWQNQAIQTRVILEQTPLAIFVKDRNGRYVFMNRTYFQSVGLPCTHRDAPDGLSLPLTASFEDGDIWESGTSCIGQQWVYQSDGWHTYLLHKFLLRNQDGQPTALCGIALDITHRLAADASTPDPQDQCPSLDLQTAIISSGRERRSANATGHDEW